MACEPPDTRSTQDPQDADLMLETTTSTTHRDMERLRNQELLMRSFVELDECKRYLPKGSRRDMWCQEPVEHLQKTESIED